MKHIIAVLGSEMLNIKSGLYEYSMKIEITEEVYNWLESHDVEYNERREKIYISNKLKYVYLGPQLLMGIPLSEGGEA